MKQFGYLYLLAYALLLAFIGVFTRQIQGIDMQTIAFTRALLATLFIMGFIIIQQDWQALKPTAVGNTLLVGIMHGLMMLLYIGALMNTSVANAILLTYTAPCFALLFSRFILKDDIPIASLKNLIFSVSGLLLIAGPQQISLKIGGSIGDWMALGSGIAYAGLMVSCKPLANKVTSTYVVLWQHIVATIILLPFVSLKAVGGFLSNAVPLICLGVLCTGLAYLLLVHGLRLVSTAQALVMTSLEPVLAIVVAASTLQETISPWTTVGATLIVYGAYRITSVTSVVPKVPQRVTVTNYM
ncbi:MAG: EamA family transporter [Chloroflexota bacterium]